MQFRRSVRRINFLSIITFLAFALVAYFSAQSAERMILESRVEDSKRKAQKISEVIVNANNAVNLEELRNYASVIGMDISLIDDKGLQTFNTKPKTHDYVFDYSFYRDVKAAMNGKLASLDSSDYREKEKKFFVSVPLRVGSQKFVLRTEQGTEVLHAGLKIFYNAILIVSIAAFFCIWFYGRLVDRKLSFSIVGLRDGLQKIIEGDRTHKFQTSQIDGDEEESLARALNKMTDKLSQQLDAAVSARKEVEAVFSRMREGVLLISADERVVKINNAAFKMLGTASSDLEGKSIEEAVRNIHLQKYIRNALRKEDSEEVELNLHEVKDRTVQVYSSLISDSTSSGNILLVVLNDITAIKQLENVRKDFVANVSHELKTPITSIQGFVETLLDGAMHNPEENKRFLEIIRRQTERLNNIFNDLLTLAGLEEDSGERIAKIEECDLKAMAENAIQVCHVESAKKNIKFILDNIVVTKLRANPSLMEQALVNLVNNAVKFSNAGEEILIESSQSDGEVKISVIDKGMGIDKAQLSRIFERFYRVDHARTREEGGTGLGLAIVKHIALVHKGRVDVQSEVGKGSKFSIIIPF